MKRSSLKLLLIGIIFIFCSNDKPSGPSTVSNITGTVYDLSDSAGITSADIVIYDANTNTPITRMLTGSSGEFSLDLDPGFYYAKISAQGYLPSPPEGGRPVPFEIGNDTLFQSFSMESDPDAVNKGSLSGTLTMSDGSAAAGILVTATGRGSGITVSGLSGPDGFYTLYNLTPDTYDLEYYTAGYVQDTSASAVVTAGNIILNVDAAMNAVTGGTVSGNVQFVATDNPKENIDVTIIHAGTRDAIPGLTDFIEPDGGEYSITDIPEGNFIVWASYRNDGYIIDPDAIFKFGLPRITVPESGIDTTISFKVTGAIQLVSPTNAPDSLYPVVINDTIPTFSWRKTSSFASAKEFIVEVYTSNGESIWGGFDKSGNIRHPKISIRDTSTVFNFDSSASEDLKPGNVYQWKVWADNDANAGVQTLLSSSEDLMGLFKIAADTTSP